MFTLQNVIRATLLRYQRLRGQHYISSTLIFISEIEKTLLSILLVFGEERSVIIGLKSIWKSILQEPHISIKICVVALIYVIQDNLTVLAMERLSVATFGVNEIHR